MSRRRVADPLLAYAKLELLTGGTALLTLPLLRGLPWAYGLLVARLGLTGFAESVGIAILAACVLLPPTILLGATVPLAVEYLARSGRGAHRGFARLYLLNTLGGAAGVALAPFVLVPALGVRGTLVAAAAVSLLIGSVARRWARDTPAVEPPRPAEADGAARLRLGRGGLELAFASGAATFGVEVLWTRSYALVIGSTVYAFNLVLLAVLLGIAIGAALYAATRSRIADPARSVGALFVVAGLAVLAGAWTIGRLPVVSLAALKLLPVSFAAHQLTFLALCFATLVPVTAILGLSFPLLLHLALPVSSGDPSPSRERNGRPAASTPGTRPARSPERSPQTSCSFPSSACSRPTWSSPRCSSAPASGGSRSASRGCPSPRRPWRSPPSSSRRLRSCRASGRGIRC